MQAENIRGLELPLPDAESARHSEQVTAHIANKIEAAGGFISFSDYMQEALYAPGLGYYVSGSKKFGSDGDFVTAPEVSDLFGRVFAMQIADVLQQIPAGNVLELGAGSGALAVQVLRKLASMNLLPERYCILEISAELRERQERLILQELPDLVQRVDWLCTLPADFRGVVLANEVADSLPVERFAIVDGRLQQLGVGNDDGSFAWRRRDPPDYLAKAVEKIEQQIGRNLEQGFESEVCVALRPWIGSLSDMLSEGFVFLFDYGVTCREYYAAERKQGWLRCHFRHRAHNDPLILPGIQDITSWIDFSAAAAAASDEGLAIAGFIAQAQFLMHGGLAQELEDFAELPADDQLELSRQTKLLTLPTEMGENFKCLGLSRGDVTSPAAFLEADQAMRL